jgi:hypothetical protein
MFMASRTTLNADRSGRNPRSPAFWSGCRSSEQRLLPVCLSQVH